MRSEYSRKHPLNLIAKLLMNSLYGRFGMEDSFVDVSILNNKSYEKFELDHSKDIINAINIGDKILVKHRAKSKDVNTLLDNASETHNISISVASAITAYARIHMSQFKNNPKIKLFYTDTDSAYVDRPLPENLVNNKVLGKMKLENIIHKAIFLAPKLYCLLTEDDKLIHKVKGLNHDIDLTMTDFESLLYKDSFIQKHQIK
jgi:DNA polymerase elongation subunit (family B)